MNNLYLSVDRDKAKEQEPVINIDLYSAGCLLRPQAGETPAWAVRFFDGLIGLNAELPHFKDYWDGYQIGYRQYCCGFLRVEINDSGMSPELATSLMAA